MELLGIRVPNPVTGAAEIAKGLATIATAPLRQPRRNVWSCPGRLHIEAHGVHGPRGQAVARRIERALEAHPGVRWARVNAPASRVIIAVDDPPPQRAALINLVARAEAEPDTEDEKIAEDELHHPADGAKGTRLLPTLAVDTLGLALSVLTKIAPWAPLPPELAALTSAVDLHPRLRELVAGRLHGHERADSATSMIGAVVHGLAARGEGTVLDIARRVQEWREARAHAQAWCRAEAELIKGPEHASAEPVVVERPRPLPESPAERYERQVMLLGAGVGAAALPFTGPRRAAAIAASSLPKATEAGMASFAAHLGRVLARRGALVMDRTVLRRLDRMDVLVLDEPALRTGRWLLNDLIALPGSDAAQLAGPAFELFDPARPRAVQRRGEWTLGPVDELRLQGRRGAREQRTLRDRGAGHVLGLAKGARLEAVVALSEETVPGVDAIAAAARDAGLRVLVATDRDRPGYAFADGTVATGSRLVAAVRELQGDDHVVLLLSGDRRALGSADCGIGVQPDGAPPPWGAHVLVGTDMETAEILVEAVQAARRVSRDGIIAAKAASGIGAVSALNARRSPTSSAMRAVNGGAAVSFADGVWRASQLGNHTAPPATNTVPWHLMPPDTVLRQLHSDRRGLDEHEARRRQRTSSGRQVTGTSLGSAFLAELANPLTPVLAGGAALSAAVGSPVDAALVAGVIGVSAMIGSIQQVHTDRSLAKLLARSAVRATVVRDGRQHRVNADELVVGDIVSLGPNDVVPADCRVLETRGLEVDESSVTGESLPVAKDPAPVVAAEIAERRSMLYEGTTISTGKATAVVVATGDATETGRSMAAARRAAPTTGVEARLTSLTRKSLPLALGSAAAVTGAGLLRGVPLRESMGAAVNLAVASVPEGLPFLVNSAQLAAARRLAERGALVRNPRTIEALGRVDVLCFDKTGTLTEGRLTVDRVDNGTRSAAPDSLDDELRRVLAAAARATPQAERPEDLSHQTDRAVAQGARRARVRTGTGARGWQKLESMPFDSSRGYHATVGRTGKRVLLSVKGAPEVVLPRCQRHRVDGVERDLDDKARRKLEQRVEQLAGSGHRVLAVAERVLDQVDASEEATRELALVGFLALADPVRDSAAPAAAKLREAGVQIVMITGDHPATGEAIASEVNGYHGEPKVITGAEIDELDDQRLDQLLPDVDVVARCSPAQKVRIIEAYRRLGRVVAMTGDGANDAPAIRLADVGIALGRRGTPAARAAADLVVTDDRLETIIAALVEGRAMWASIREALGILLGGNLGEIGFSVLGSALTGRSPLTARQLLLLNLLTDLAPAMAIATSRPARESVPELLREGPTASLGGALNRDIGMRAVTTTLGATAAWTAARLTGRSKRAGTVALASLVGTQLGQTLITGGLDRTVLAAGLGSAAALGGVIQTPGVSQFFGCTPLGPIGWGIALSSATAASLLGLVLSRGPIADRISPIVSDAEEEAAGA